TLHDVIAPSLALGQVVLELVEPLLELVDLAPPVVLLEVEDLMQASSKAICHLSAQIFVPLLSDFGRQLVGLMLHAALVDQLVEQRLVVLSYGAEIPLHLHLWHGSGSTGRFFRLKRELACGPLQGFDAFGVKGCPEVLKLLKL